MAAEYSFRDMEVADIKKVVAIEQISFPDPWTTRTFYQELTCNSFAFYSVLVDQLNQVIGYSGFWLVLDEAQVTKIAVHPTYRGLGQGEKLLAHCMDQSRSLGAKKMTLEVRASNAHAQLLYKKLGFASAGIRPRFYQIEPEDAIMMWVNLDEETSRTWN